ncbi:hypothetical protein GCM10020367_68240 [Streptomyces sannanensis]|uniref:Uncharacterized protein n=1 Tax=Streptomyces sannanensis TaxID=285536 RepID=A0ABP6S3L8_9ACTN
MLFEEAQDEGTGGDTEFLEAGVPRARAQPQPGTPDTVCEQGGVRRGIEEVSPCTTSVGTQMSGSTFHASC